MDTFKEIGIAGTLQEANTVIVGATGLPAQIDDQCRWPVCFKEGNRILYTLAGGRTGKRRWVPRECIRLCSKNAVEIGSVIIKNKYWA